MNSRIEQARQALNPHGLDNDPLTGLRNQLVNRGKGHRGGKEQVAFLQAIDNNDLLNHLVGAGVGQDFTVLTVPTLPSKMQESEFVKAPVTAAQTVRHTYRDLTPQEASSVSVWNAITLYNIQAGQLEAPYLAASSEKETGRQRIQKVLRQRADQKIDDCVRTVFRTMGGLRLIRGNVSVISDCTLSRYWWMGQMIEATAQRFELDEARAWEELSRHWDTISLWAIKRLTIIGNPVLMAGLIRHLLDNPVPTQEKMKNLLRQVGMRFSEVSPYTWTVSEIQDALEQGI